MKTLVAMSMVVAMGLGLAGCASSGTAQHAHVAVGRGSNVVASGPVPQDPNPHGVAVAASENLRSLGDPDLRGAGVPTPEPAAPEHEIRLAGPTPQIPIPRSGAVAIPRD
jgi:putative hemolysin